MKPFQKMPSYSTWKSKSSAWFALRSSDTVLKQIDDLVKLYHQRADAQMEIAFQIYRGTHYWLKHLGGKVKGADGRIEAIAHLNGFIRNEFQRVFDVDANQVDEVMTLAFGKPVHVHYEQTEVLNEARTVAYVIDEVARRDYKLVFRHGFAYKRSQAGLTLYDTIDDNGKNGKGEAIFVMDRNGHIFTGGYDSGLFHHSSFLAGNWSMAAGVMKVTGGQVVSVCPDSGHYQPGKQQMINVVERLKTYNVNLLNLTVNLFTYETEGSRIGQPKVKFGKFVWDSCRADIFLSRR